MTPWVPHLACQHGQRSLDFSCQWKFCFPLKSASEASQSQEVLLLILAVTFQRRAIKIMEVWRANKESQGIWALSPRKKIRDLPWSKMCETYLCGSWTAILFILLRMAQEGIFLCWWPLSVKAGCNNSTAGCKNQPPSAPLSHVLPPPPSPGLPRVRWTKTLELGKSAYLGFSWSKEPLTWAISNNWQVLLSCCIISPVFEIW